MSSDQSIYKSTTQATFPTKEVYSVSKSVVIDSRQRDCAKYKNPSLYTINIGETFKNITSLELKGAIVPKSNYNIHSANNRIDFSLGSFISGFKIIDGGAGYTFAPTITISNPLYAGTTATATAMINAGGSISSIMINVAGSGYVASKPPFVEVSRPTNSRQAVQPRIEAIVGYTFTATLRTGEYEIGGNPIPPAVLPSGLLLEIQNAMNYAVNGGNYDPASTSPFTVRLVSQYPALGAASGSPEASDTNACLFNRIQVTNVNNTMWEFLWCSGPNHIINAASVLGFNTIDTGIGTLTNDISNGDGVLIPGGLAIRAPFDFNLTNDPDYVILTIALNDTKMERINSLDDGLDNRFAVLLFDNNYPDTLHDLSSGTGGSIVSVDGIKYLSGPVGKGSFWRPVSSVKAMKGSDYDSKKLSWKPPLSKVSSITIQFTKFGYYPGEGPVLYNMEGREHLLLFELSATDNKSQMKD
jgi:hypothetical protein